MIPIWYSPCITGNDGVVFTIQSFMDCISTKGSKTKSSRRSYCWLYHSHVLTSILMTWKGVEVIFTHWYNVVCQNLQMKIQYMFIILVYLGYWANHNCNMEWGKSWITCLWTCNKCQMWCSICTLCGWYIISGSGSDNFHVYSGGSKCIGGSGIIGHDVYDYGIANDIMTWSWSQWCCHSLSFL